VVTGEPQLLEAEPGSATEAALQPLHRVQTVGQAPEDPNGATRFVRRQAAVRVGVRVHQVRRKPHVINCTVVYYYDGYTVISNGLSIHSASRCCFYPSIDK